MLKKKKKFFHQRNAIKSQPYTETKYLGNLVFFTIFLNTNT